MDQSMGTKGVLEEMEETKVVGGPEGTLLVQEEEKREEDGDGLEGLRAGLKSRHLKKKKQVAVLVQLKQRGNAALKSGDLEKAIELYTQGLQRCENFVAASNGEERFDEQQVALLTNRAQVYFRKGKFEQALQDAEKSLQVDEHWAKGYLWKARALKELGQDSEGASCLGQGVDKVGRQSKEASFFFEECKRLFSSSS